MGKYLLLSVGVLMLAILLETTAFADGFIIPIPPPDVPHVPPLSIKYHHVSVEINDQVARTKVDQVFLNEFHRDLEGTYIFPLPKGAQITEFAMFINGERVSGELLERDKARKIYQDIVNRMKDPALLEYFDRDLFQVRVYPIPARGEKRIQLEYAEVLKSDAGMVRYHYPLDTERFSAKPLHDVSINVTIRSQKALKTVYSPSHEVAVSRKDDHAANASYEDTNVIPAKDFVLYYTVSDNAVGANLLTYKKTREDGYFMLMLSPGSDHGASVAMPKDIVFVLDTSGSMRHDNKMAQAQNALIYGVEGLNPEDRFGIVTFSTTVNVFDNALRKGTKEDIANAVQFVRELKERGGTDIYEALKTALEMLGAENAKRPQMVVFITDGRPTVGITDYTEILQKVQKQNTARARIFAFGVGYDVNTHLLDPLAEDNKAASAYIAPKEDLEVVVSAFFDKIDAPVLSDVDVKFDGGGVYDLFPKDLPDLFKGSQLLLVGRYRDSGAFRLTLAGMMNGQENVSRYDVNLPASELSHDFIPRIWASRKIGYLLDQIRLHGEDQELKEEVVELAKKFGIVTPYTSYLVTEDEEIPGRRTENIRPAPFSGLSRSVAPQELGDAVYKTDKGAAPAAAPEFSESKEGELAVRMSKDVNDLKQRARDTDAVSSQMRYIGTKTFYFVNERWLDSEYKEGAATVKIEYGSDAYFALLTAAPEMGKYLSLANKMIVCWNEQVCLEIGQSGISKADDATLREVMEQLR